MIRTCRDCGETKALELFSVDKKGKMGRSRQCKECKNKSNRLYYKNNPEYKRIYMRSDKRKDYVYKRLYGITLDEYRSLYKNQDGRCSICGKQEKTLYVDHNHKNGKVISLLCHRCNSALGFVFEDIDILKKMIDYIIFHGDA